MWVTESVHLYSSRQFESEEYESVATCGSSHLRRPLSPCRLLFLHLRFTNLFILVTMFLSALLACPAAHQGNTSHLYFLFPRVWTQPAFLCLLLTLALNQQTPVRCQCRLSTVSGRSVARYFQSELLLSAPSFQNNRTLPRRGKTVKCCRGMAKMKESGAFFSSNLTERDEKDQLATLKGAKTTIFTLSENNPCAHIMPSVRWSYMSSLLSNWSNLNSHNETLTSSFWIQGHLESELLSAMIWCLDFIIGSCKEKKTPTAGVRTSADCESHSYCLFLLMLYPFRKKLNQMRSLFGWGNDSRLAAPCPAWGLSGCHKISTPKSLNASQFWQTENLAWG